MARRIKKGHHTFGGLDGLHLNAADLEAVVSDTDVSDVPLEIFDRTLQVNLRGHFLCTRHALPALLRRGGGSIVYTSSGAAFMGEPLWVAYAISKNGRTRSSAMSRRDGASRGSRERRRAGSGHDGRGATLDDRRTENVLAITRSHRPANRVDTAAVAFCARRWRLDQRSGVAVDGGHDALRNRCWSTLPPSSHSYAHRATAWRGAAAPERLPAEMAPADRRTMARAAACHDHPAERILADHAVDVPQARSRR
jgi:NAD(P)-dependent dehydrogenase (short-subunit alcohol dehydrogenase family)